MKVNFFIAGAPKSGTTSLYQYLCQHKEIEMCSIKEPDFFSSTALKKEQTYYVKLCAIRRVFDDYNLISDHIKKNSYYAIGIASVNEILNFNILQASLLSMKRAIVKLKVKPGLTLIDGNFAPIGLKNYRTIINGDEKIKVISAASIIAKVYRDRLMIKLSKKFSNYAWDRNFGYGTKAHLKGLKKFGITAHHRKGFKPIHKILSS